MLPKYHIILGIFFVAVIYFIFPEINLFYLAIVLLSSILIDADHYFYYILKTKNLSLPNALKWYNEKRKVMLSLSKKERKKIYSGFYIFHGIEWIITLALLGRFVFPILTYVSIGFLFHFAVDTPHEFYFKRTIQKSSLIYMAYLFIKEGKKEEKQSSN
jgi:hypothetical protein